MEAVGRSEQAPPDRAGDGADTLRELRVARGLTQVDVAGALNLPSAATLSEWERGRRSVAPSYYPRLAELYGTTPERIERCAEDAIAEVVSRDSTGPRASTPLAELRAAQGFSQRDVALELNLPSPTTLSVWERGGRPVPSTVVPRLAELYGTTEEEIRQCVEVADTAVSTADPSAPRASGPLGELRVAQGLTQKEVAARLGLRVESTLSLWETDRRAVPSSYVPSLAALYGTTEDAIRSLVEIEREPPRSTDRELLEAEATAIVERALRSRATTTFLDVLGESAAAYRDVPLSDLHLKARTSNVISRWDVRTIGELLNRRISDLLAQRSAGVATATDLLAALLGLLPVREDGKADSGRHTQAPISAEANDEALAAFERALAASGEIGSEDPDASGAEGVRREALHHIVAALFASSGNRTMQASAEALLEVVSVHARDHLRPHARALGDWTVRDFAGSALSKVDPVAAVVDALDELDPGSRSVLLWRRGRPDQRRTLQEAGDELAVSRERARQIERRAMDAMSAVLGRAPGSALLDVVEEVLHPVVPKDELYARVAAALPGLRSLDEELRADLVWVAAEAMGVSHDIPDHVGTGSGTASVRERVAEMAEERTADELQADLVAAGVAPQDLQQLMGALGLVAFRGRVVPAGATRADRLEIVLRDAGRALSVAELVAGLPGGEGRLRDVLSTDPRFVRTDKSAYGLAEWDLAAYGGITEALVGALQDRGGEAAIADLIEDVTARFSVSENSVRAYARSPEFIPTGPGRIRARTPGEAPRERDFAPLELCPGCMRFGDRWALRVSVDEKLLRGFSPPIPEAFAAHLGARPLQTLEVATDLGPISVVRAALGANLGRLRAIAKHFDLLPGDVLFVVAPESDDELVTFDFRQAADPAGDPESLLKSRFCLEGEDIGASDVAARLDLPTDASRSNIIVRLRSRDELELADAVAEFLPPDEDSASDDIARILGL